MQGRKPMMQHWNADAVRFMRDATDYSDYHAKLAEILMTYFSEDGHICDAGCGNGALSLELAKRCRAVTAIDISEAAIAELRGKCLPENLQVLCADIFTQQPETQYDGIVFCYFGRMNEVFHIAKQQCRGSVVIVKRNCAEHHFSMGKVCQHTHEPTEDVLANLGIPFQRRFLSLEFGQPFRCLDDAMGFFRLYNKSDVPVTPEAVALRLKETSDKEFPLYLPEKRNMDIFTFRASDIP